MQEPLIKTINNKIGNLSTNGITEPSLAVAIKNDRTQLAEKASLSSVNFKACYVGMTLQKLHQQVEDVLITFIGDSVTCGSNATDQLLLSYTGLFASWIAEQFPNSTVKLARGSNIQSLKPLSGFTETIIQTGTKNTVTIVNAGIWGDSMFQLFNRTDNFTSYNSKTPDCIFIMDSINDSDPGNLNRYSDNNTFKELQAAFVDYLRDTTGAEIVIQTSHWTGENPNSRINPYVLVQRELAKEKNLLLIDHKAAWDAHFGWTTSNHGQGAWMDSGDSIHPINAGHVTLKDTIVNNLYKTKTEDNKVINTIVYNDSKITYTGTWTNVAITDANAKATFNYNRGGGTTGDYCGAGLTGNEIYLIVRDGRDNVTFNNNSPDYTNEQIKIGGMVYPSQFVTVNNADMYSKHHKRILLYKGAYKYCGITIQCVSGNLDIYGFETVTYKDDIKDKDTSTTLSLYTDSINGDDINNDGLSTAKPFKTIAKAINYSIDYLDKMVTINVMQNTTENIDMSMIFPQTSNGYVIKGYNNITKNVGFIHCQQVGKIQFNYLKTITTSDYSILLNDVSYCKLSNVDISDTTNQTKTGLYMTNGSKCYAFITADYKNELVHCENESSLTIGLANNPTNSTTLANVQNGGVIKYTNANIPQYTSKLTKGTGGVMFNVNGTLL